jgi:hypothetical protein
MRTNFGSSASVATWTLAGLPGRVRKSHTVRPADSSAFTLDIDRDELGRQDRRVDDGADGESVVDGGRA